MKRIWLNSMKTVKSITVILFLLGISIGSYAQPYIKSEYTMPSSMKNHDNNDTGGKGGFFRTDAAFMIPLSMKVNELKQPTVWMASIGGTYARFDNENIPQYLCPDEVINAVVNISHIRPLSEKWMFTVSFGGGIYSAPDAITIKSVLVNGVVSFNYQLGKKVKLGLGAAVTNSYGTPMALPALFVDWDLGSKDKYELVIKSAYGLNISFATKLNDKLKLRLVGLDMDGLSSVIEVEGDSKIFGTRLVKSSINLEYNLGKKVFAFIGAGGTWSRKTTVSDRSIKELFNAFSLNKSNEYHFDPSLNMSIGLKYGF